MLFTKVGSQGSKTTNLKDQFKRKGQFYLQDFLLPLKDNPRSQDKSNRGSLEISKIAIIKIEIKIMNKINNIRKMKGDLTSKKEDIINKGKNNLQIGDSRIQDIKATILNTKDLNHNFIIGLIIFSNDRSFNSKELIGAAEEEEVRAEVGVEGAEGSMQGKIYNKINELPLQWEKSMLQDNFQKKKKVRKRVLVLNNMRAQIVK